GARGPSWLACFVDPARPRSEEHTSELQSRSELVCRLLLEKKKQQPTPRLSAQPRTPPSAGSRFGPAAGRTPRSIPPASAPSPFFFNVTATTEIYTLSLHDALPI